MTATDAITHAATKEPTRQRVVYEDAEAFDFLRDDWLELEQRDSRCGIFQSHAWLSHIWAFEVDPHRQMQLVTVRGADGRLDAVMPLVTEKRLGPVGVRVMRFLGRGFSDYQDILLADDCDRDATLKLLADWLADRMERLDLLELTKLQEGTHLWEHRHQLLPEEMPRCMSEAQADDQSRYFPIETDFDAYLMSLSKPTRKNYRRYWDRLNKAHSIQLRTLASSRGVDELLDELVRLHQNRQAEKGQRGMFRSPKRIELFTRLFKALLDEGTMRLHVLEVDGQVYNLELVFYYKHTATAYNGGMDHHPEVAKHSPGFIAMMKIIEEAHDDKQLTKFDLGQGNEDYKRHIARYIQSLHRLSCTRSGLRSRLDQGCHTLLAWAQQNAVVQRLYFGVRPKSTPGVISGDDGEGQG